MKSNNKSRFIFDVVIIGGLGHVGLPLGIIFAQKGLKTCLCDINTFNADMVKKGIMPFMEHGAESILKETLKSGKISISLDQKSISKGKHIIIAIGTPVDGYLNPNTRAFFEIFLKFKKYLNKNQIIIVRSTVYPHTCQQMVNMLGSGNWRVAYCPERIAQGHAIKELSQLPQIVSGITEESTNAAAKLFSKISPKIIKTSIAEAELAKLFSNAWRYIQFAVTNQFYMISENFSTDYAKVRQAMVDGYGRTASLPTAGFAAGPCLFKDTMQLAAFNSNNFILGHAAMMVNEGLPNFIVELLRDKYDLSRTKVGILGMAFKADIDDIRDSLSYKLGKILRFHRAKVFYSDEYAKDPTFVSKEKLIRLSDVIIIGVPHTAYKGLKFPKKTEIIDLWEIINR